MNLTSLSIALLLIMLLALYLYRFSGRRQFLRLDLIQFIYAFVVYPLAFLWMQELLLLFYRSVPEIGPVDQRIISSSVNLIFLYLYAFGIMHSLTKTLSLRVYRDPLFDVFSQTEYVHEFLSHVGMYTGIFALGSVLSVINIVFPFDIVSTRQAMAMTISAGTILGIALYIVLFITTDKGIGYTAYKKIIRAVAGLSFTAHVILFVLFRPALTMHHGVFWLVASILTAFVLTRMVLIPTQIFWSILKKFGIEGGKD